MSNSVEIFPWDDNFDTGITEIDDQHKKLVALLNQLASQLAFQFNPPIMDVIFNELTDYATYHFRSEEAIWQRYFGDDDWNKAHQATHALFIDNVLMINKFYGAPQTRNINAYRTA